MFIINLELNRLKRTEKKKVRKEKKENKNRSDPIIIKGSKRISTG